MAMDDTLTANHALQILNRCPNLVYVYDVIEQRNAYANREIATVLGYTEAEIQALGAALFVTLMHPDDLQRLPSHHERLMAASDEDVCEFEYRMRHKDGDWRWLVSRDVIFARLADGQVRQYLGVVEDISQKRHALDWAQRALAMTPLLVYVFDYETQQNIYANGQLSDVLGYSTEELQSMGSNMLKTLMDPDDFQALPAVQQQILQANDEDTVRTSYRMRRKDGSWAWIQDHVRVFMRTSDGRVKQYMGATQDISDRKREEEERIQLQEQVIEAQQLALRELSTPLIPVSNDVLVMPLIGTIDSQRASLVMETLLEGVAEKQASTVIVDITGVQMVDSQIANALIRAAQAINLLGAQAVITGIRPEVAQTIVGLGIDLGAIVTRGTLQSGIAYALRLSGERPGG